MFWTYHNLSSPTLLLSVTFIILVCYGGGYGITPAFAADYFGPRYVGPIFGLMLVPWAFPAAFGPLAFAYLRQVTGGYNQPLYLIAALLTVAMILPIVVRAPKGSKASKDVSAGSAVPVGTQR